MNCKKEMKAKQGGNTFCSRDCRYRFDNTPLYPQVKIANKKK